MKVSSKVLLPIVFFAVSSFIAWQIMENPSTPKTLQSPLTPELNVEVERLYLDNYTVYVTTYGLVRPRTESSLVAQVSGMITQVSDKFQEGAFFEEGDLLVQIEGQDYQSAVIMAESDYVQASYQLSEEEARGKQAKANWDRIGNKAGASDLVLRKPQLAAAKARAASAKARLEQAKLDLARTQIKAPYAGRVLKKNVDRGQFIVPNTPVAELYAVDYLEVRLPLSSRQREFVFVPEQYRHQQEVSDPLPAVQLKSSVGRTQYDWTGVITRAEGALDANSRQLNVIAQVDDPYLQREDNAPPLKIGQFVQATIRGITLNDVFIIKRGSLYEDEYVIVVEDNKLVKKAVDIIWSDGAEAIVAQRQDSLRAGDLLVTSPIGNAVSGTQVVIVGEDVLHESVKRQTVKRQTVKAEQ